MTDKQEVMRYCPHELLLFCLWDFFKNKQKNSQSLEGQKHRQGEFPKIFSVWLHVVEALYNGLSRFVQLEKSSQQIVHGLDHFQKQLNSQHTSVSSDILMNKYLLLCLTSLTHTFTKKFRRLRFSTRLPFKPTAFLPNLMRSWRSDRRALKDNRAKHAENVGNETDGHHAGWML